MTGTLHHCDAGHRDGDQAQSAKAAKVSRREGTPLFSPSRLRAAVIKIAPRFKVLDAHQQRRSALIHYCMRLGISRTTQI